MFQQTQKLQQLQKQKPSSLRLDEVKKTLGLVRATLKSVAVEKVAVYKKTQKLYSKYTRKEATVKQEVKVNFKKLGLGGLGDNENRKYVGLQFFKECYPTEVVDTETVKRVNFDTHKLEEVQTPKVSIVNERYLPEMSWVRVYTLNSVYEYKVYEHVESRENGNYKYTVTQYEVKPRKKVAVAQ